MPSGKRYDGFMPKHFPHFLVITLAVALGIILALQLFRTSFSLPSQMFARIPASVGNKPAPIPVLKVENVTISNRKSISATQIRSALQSSVGNKHAQYTLQEYQLQWNVSVEDGSLAPVMAQVFVPVVPEGEALRQFPVIVYGAGTTGLADRCAPSREDLSRGNMGNYRNYMISEASQGYIVVMPNYEGFDNPRRNQHYFNKDNEARTMLSAAKALVTAAPNAGIPAKQGAVFLGGYSQGGHAAFSAVDYADTYLPDIEIAGVFGHGPTTNIVGYLKSNPNLTAYFIASYSEYYPAIDPKQILEPEWIGYLERAKKLCVDEGFGINSTTIARVFADPFEKALVNNTLATDFPAVNKVFDENNAGTSYVGIPTMIAQGSIDPVVTPKTQDVFINQLCARGVSVNLKEYKGVHHFNTRQASFSDTNTWIDAITQGKTVNNSCVTRK